MSELAKALAEFQAEMPTVAKGQTANVPTKNGGSYSYSYADLADVCEAAMPLLTKHGLSFSCQPRRCDDGSYELAGVLLHTSGERETGALPVFGRSPQEIGSSLTYGRRYLLGCMTGVVTDTDDDGQAAQGARPTSTRKMTEAQNKFMGQLMSKLGMTDRDLALQFVRDVIQRDVESSTDLTAGEASRVIEALKKDAENAGQS